MGVCGKVETTENSIQLGVVVEIQVTSQDYSEERRSHPTIQTSPQTHRSHVRSALRRRGTIRLRREQPPDPRWRTVSDGERFIRVCQTQRQKTEYG